MPSGAKPLPETIMLTQFIDVYIAGLVVNYGISNTIVLEIP